LTGGRKVCNIRGSGGVYYNERQVRRLQYGELCVAIDLDDTALSLKNGIIPFNDAYFGAKVAPEDYCGDWFGSAWGAKFHNYEDWVREIDENWWTSVKHANVYENLRATPGAAKTLQSLRKYGVRLVILTSRTGRMLKDETMLVLEREFVGIDFEEIIFLGDYSYGMPKGRAARKVGAHILIDDSERHINSAIEYGVMGILFGDTPDISGVTTDESRGLYRARNWPEVDVILPRILSRL